MRLVPVMAAIALGIGGTGAAPPLKDHTRPHTCPLTDSLQGVTGHALLHYLVDDIGNTASPQVLFSRVDPPARAHELEQHLVACVDSWRYQPQPHPSMQRGQTPFLLGFHYFRPAPSGSPMVQIDAVRRVPKVWVDEMGQVRNELAMLLLSGKDYHEEKGDGWSLRTNVERAERFRAIDTMRQSRELFDAAFPDARTAAPAAVTLYLFARTGQFEQLVAFDNVAWIGPVMAGKYHPGDRVAYAGAEEQPVRLTAQVIAHEMTHHFVHEMIEQPNRNLPSWVDEGIAEFVTLAAEPILWGRKDEIDLRRFIRGRQSQGGYSWLARGDAHLQAIQDAQRRGTPIPSSRLVLGNEAQEFELRLFYASSWALVHYLMTGEEGALRRGFVEWLRQENGEGADGAALLAKIGMRAEQLDAAVASHCRRIRKSR